MAKTVTCEKCGGVQAIFRDENGGMKCAFCGEEIENLPPYEQGEELSYGAAESAAQPEGEPAEAVFTLNRQEVEDALLLTGRIKPHIMTSVVETVLLVLLLAMQCTSVIGGMLHWKDYPEPGGMNYFLLAVIVVLIPVVWIMPRRNNRRIVDRSVSGNELRVRVYENLCEVFIPADDKGWDVTFGKDSFCVSECEEMFVLTLSDGRLLALPKRGFEGDGVAIARERLTDAAGGLTPFEEKALRRSGKLDCSRTAETQDAAQGEKE